MAWLTADARCHREKETLSPCPCSQIPLGVRGDSSVQVILLCSSCFEGTPSHLLRILALCSSTGSVPTCHPSHSPTPTTEQIIAFHSHHATWSCCPLLSLIWTCISPAPLFLVPGRRSSLKPFLSPEDSLQWSVYHIALQVQFLVVSLSHKAVI